MISSGAVKRKKVLLKGILGLAFLVLVLSFSARAARAQAVLYVSPAAGTYKIGELFSALVNVNTGDQAINAAGAQLNFDNAKLEVTSLGYSRSVFSIWTEEPVFSNAGGTLKFSGGLPSPGYVGSSGIILRITFKARAPGQASLAFISGSVLANDGKGTNLLNGFRGATYNILSASPPAQTPPKETAPAAAPAVAAEKSFAPPILTEWPSQLEEGEVLTVKGLGFPGGKVLVYFQKGNEDPVTEERYAAPDGRFTGVLENPVKAGFYRIWAKNIASDGTPSASSDVINIEVTQPLFFRIGTIALNYSSIAVALIAIIVLLILVLGWLWIRFRRWRQSQGEEIGEAEKALHLGFDKLKEGLGAYIGYLGGAKSGAEIHHREESTKQELKKQLEDIEEEIEKEVEDVGLKKRKR